MIAPAAHSACFRATSARRGGFQIAQRRAFQFVHRGWRSDENTGGE
jgi:hypothetical protein